MVRSRQTLLVCVGGQRFRARLHGRCGWYRPTPAHTGQVGGPRRPALSGREVALPADERGFSGRAADVQDVGKWRSKGAADDKIRWSRWRRVAERTVDRRRLLLRESAARSLSYEKQARCRRGSAHSVAERRVAL